MNVFINYGRDRTVQSDRKPPKATANMPLACVPPRLQRMLRRLQRDNVKVVYMAGKQIPLRDTLSRIFVKTEPKLPRDDLEDSAQVQNRYFQTMGHSFLLRICTICKYMGIRPFDIQSPISKVEWVGREGRADCEENHNEDDSLGSISLHRSTVVLYDPVFRTAEIQLHSW